MKTNPTPAVEFGCELMAPAFLLGTVAALAPVPDRAALRVGQAYFYWHYPTGTGHVGRLAKIGGNGLWLKQDNGDPRESLVWLLDANPGPEMQGIYEVLPCAD